MSWYRITAVAVAGTLALSLGVVHAPNVAAKPPCAKPAGLATGIQWDYSDPGYMKIVPVVTWKNCRGVIRKVSVELRSVLGNGGLSDSPVRQDFFADVVHKPNRSETYRFSRYLLDGKDNDPDDVGFESASSGNVLKTCSQRADGSAPPDVASTTFYVVATAYDVSGREILKKVSPPVSCGVPG